jgi:hypothetical protein
MKPPPLIAKSQDPSVVRTRSWINVSGYLGRWRNPDSRNPAGRDEEIRPTDAGRRRDAKEKLL